jgi:hypothetical protein
MTSYNVTTTSHPWTSASSQNPTQWVHSMFLNLGNMQRELYWDTTPLQALTHDLRSLSLNLRQDSAVDEISSKVSLCRSCWYVWYAWTLTWTLACEPCRKSKHSCDNTLPTYKKFRRRKVTTLCVYPAAPMTRPVPDTRTRSEALIMGMLPTTSSIDSPVASSVDKDSCLKPNP